MPISRRQPGDPRRGRRRKATTTPRAMQNPQVTTPGSAAKGGGILRAHRSSAWGRRADLAGSDHRTEIVTRGSMTTPSTTTSSTQHARIAVVGAGYVGVTTAVCLAHHGHAVVCGDNDLAKVEKLSAGIPTFVEEGLGALLNQGLSSRRLHFVTSA